MLEQFKDGDVTSDYKSTDWIFGNGWDPRDQTWREFEQELDTMYETYKKLYREHAEKFLMAKGYVKGKDKRNLNHFEWLIRYQIQGWTLKEIADHYSTSTLLMKILCGKE